MTVTKWGLSWECEIDLTNKNHLIHFIRKNIWLHMIVIIDTEKDLDEVQYSCVIMALNKLKGNSLSWKGHLWTIHN